MSGPAPTWVLGLLIDPRFGVPFLLLVEATMIWTYTRPRGLATLGALRQGRGRPAGDPVSRMFHAIGDRRFSVVIRWSRERLGELYQARNGHPLPTPLLSLHREPAEAPGDLGTLQRLNRDLSTFEWEAREREAGLHYRWTFWRTRRGEEARYRARVARLLGRAQESITALEGGT